MAGLENDTARKLMRMPSLAEWGLVNLEGDSSISAVLAERTAAVASVAAAAAPHSGTETDVAAERVAPALPPVAPPVTRMPSLGAWAMSEHIAAAETAEEKDLTRSGDGKGGNLFKDERGDERAEARVREGQVVAENSGSVKSSSDVKTNEKHIRGPPESGMAGNDTPWVKRKDDVNGKKSAPKPAAKRLKKTKETSAPTRRSKRTSARGVPQQ